MGDIQFQGIITKITTTIDGGWKITFDVGQHDAQAILILAELRNELMTLKAKVASEMSRES